MRAVTLLAPQKVLVIPRNRWLRLNMTEKLFTGTLNHNKNKKQKTLLALWFTVYGFINKTGKNDMICNYHV